MGSKISVIVPIYKVEKYLNQCIESIVKQTYKNLEIILVDDGSPDSCPDICDEWAKKDERIIVIHERNAGLPSARNAGLLVATGEFVSFVDSDDFLSTDLYEKVIPCFKDIQIDIVEFSFFDYINENNCYASHIGGYCQSGYALISKILLMDGTAYSFAWNKIYRKSILRDIFFDSNLKYGEDTPFVFLAMASSKQMLQIDKPYYFYRKRADSFVNSSFNEAKLLSIEAGKLIYDMCVEKKLETLMPYSRFHIFFTCLLLFEDLNKNSKNGNETIAKQIITESKICNFQNLFIVKGSRLLKSLLFFFTPRFYGLLVRGRDYVNIKK